MHHITTNQPTRRPLHRPDLIVAVTLLALSPLTACGGDDGASDAAPVSEVSSADQVDGAATDPAELPSAANDEVGSDPGGEFDPEAGLLDAIGGEGTGDIIAELGIGVRANALAVALNGSWEEIDESSARIIKDGDVNDTIMDCIVVGSFLEPGETIFIRYPNGETSCS